MQHITAVLSSLGQTPDVEPMPEPEVKARVRQCARLFAAWPNARPASVDATLLEYVNATRGVPIDSLPALIDLVRDAGGEFLPPAGAVLERAAKFLATSKRREYNPALSIEQRIADDVHDNLRALKAATRETAPLLLEDVERALLGTGTSLARIGAGGFQ